MHQQIKLKKGLDRYAMTTIFRSRLVIQCLFMFSIATGMSACDTTPPKKITSMKTIKSIRIKADNGNKDALHILRHQANMGNIYAEFQLGKYYGTVPHFINGYSPERINKDWKLYDYWIDKSAEDAEKSNNAYFENYLGIELISLLPDIHNHTMIGLELFKKAVSLGYVRAEKNLGSVYYWGPVEDDSIPRNYIKSTRLYRMAAINGDVSAEADLGRAYAHGYGIKQNYSKAVYWFKKAAEKGNGKAEYYLGDSYYLGHGVPQNTTMAIKLWKKSLSSKQTGMFRYYVHKKLNIAEKK